MGSKRSVVELDPPPANTATACLDPEVRQYFDETSDYWNGIYSGKSFVNWHMSHRRQLVVDAVQRFSKGRPLRVLDFGCGTGVLTRDLVKLGHTVVALDISETMVRGLMSHLDARDGERFAGAAIASVGSACFESGAFDAVICVGVLQYQRTPAAVFREIERLLKPGGMCAFTAPNQLSLHHLLDPWVPLRYVYRLLARTRRNGKSWSECLNTARDRTQYVDRMYDRRFFLHDLKRELKAAHSLAVRETIGFGYGPLTVANKAVAPDRVSIGVSKALMKLSQFRPFSWLSALANRWVVVLEKSAV